MGGRHEGSSERVLLLLALWLYLVHGFCAVAAYLLATVAYLLALLL